MYATYLLQCASLMLSSSHFSAYQQNGIFFFPCQKKIYYQAL